MAEQHPRKPNVWCRRCRRPQAELVYLSDGNHYCWDCAEHLHRTLGLEAAGKRADDIDPWSPSR